VKILVAYGSKRGGTAEIAQTIGTVFGEAGFEFQVMPAQRPRDVESYDAVIVGGALYANRWHGDARRFVKRNAAALRKVPTWLFSSGPLDDSAAAGGIAPVAQVEQLMARVGARGHITFGGRLLPDAKGFPASAMAKTLSGDWRDPDRIRAWALTLVSQLMAKQPEVMTPMTKGGESQ
jgi:menaquinone-dependent protoporphyrinogen oxidase